MAAKGKGALRRSFRKVKQAIRPTRARSAPAGTRKEGALRKSFRKVANRVRGGGGRGRSHSPTRGGFDDFQDEPNGRVQARKRKSVGRALHNSFRKAGKSRVVRGARNAARKSFRSVKKSRVGRAAGRSFRKVKKSRVGRAAQRSFRRIAPKEKCPFWKIMCYIVPFIFIVVSSFGVVASTGNVKSITPDTLRDFIPTFSAEDFRRNDPFSGRDGIPIWNNGGTGGLELKFLNGLTDDFQKVYELALADWDNGNPDALTLTSSKIPQESECKPTSNVVKVCSGDYGETKWRGLSLAASGSDGYIASNICKFNDFYLKWDDEGTRQYTMCHEIGHSFGLPHTDEDFNNEDLGNCLDYTNNYNENKHPDVTNYESLADMYGTVARRNLRGQSFAVQDAAASSPGRYNTDDSTATPMPSHVHDEMMRVFSKLEKRLDDNAHEDGWKLLHRTKYGEEHEMELQDGYKVRVHMLLAH